MAKEKKPFAGFTDEERRMRVRLLEMGKRQMDISDATGICRADIAKAFKGTCRSPAYVAEVYRFLGLDMPNGADNKEGTA